MAHPRDLDQPLIEAYLARRALDYLVGFTLSPVLWRKLPGSRSAGRVQSVALRLICEREAEIEAFRAARILDGRGAVHHAGRRAVHRAADASRRQEARPVRPAQRGAGAARQGGASRPGRSPSARSRSKRVKRNPPPPFTTSTLQQEASRKLGFGAQQTMRLAQQLYEGVDLDGETTGLITYMRTDGVQMAREAIAAIREHVSGSYGAELPAGGAARIHQQGRRTRRRRTRRSARPTSPARRTASPRYLNNDQRRLYELIWKRAVASQMQSAELDQVSVEVTDGKGTTLRATGSIVAFDGFLKLYREDTDDAGARKTRAACCRRWRSATRSSAAT